MKLGEFIHALLVKGGGNSEAEALKNFFSISELNNIDVPEELSNAIDHNLLSLKDATNNHPEIKKHYDKQLFDTVDKIIGSTIEELPEDARQAVLGEKNTFKRIPLLATKIKEVEAKKFEAATTPDKAALQQQKEAWEKQVKDLTYEVRKSKEDIVGVKKEADARVQKIKVSSELRGLLNQYKTVYDELPPAAKAAAIESLINSELAQNAAEFVLDENEVFTLRKKDGTTYLSENHQEVKPQAFVESLLSKNKLLKVTKPNGQDSSDDNDNSSNGQQNSGNNGNQQSTRNHALKDLVRTSREALKNSGASSVM